MFNLNIRTIFYLRFTDFYVETVLHKAELEDVPFGIEKCISGENSVYFYLVPKNESILCNRFLRIIVV